MIPSFTGPMKNWTCSSIPVARVRPSGSAPRGTNYTRWAICRFRYCAVVEARVVIVLGHPAPYCKRREVQLHAPQDFRIWLRKTVPLLCHVKDDLMFLISLLVLWHDRKNCRCSTVTEMAYKIGKIIHRATHQPRSCYFCVPIAPCCRVESCGSLSRWSRKSGHQRGPCVGNGVCIEPRLHRPLRRRAKG